MSWTSHHRVEITAPTRLPVVMAEDAPSEGCIAEEHVQRPGGPLIVE
ncbi:hypothetical protein [Kineococcus xinjiangensis]|nr:hypothetical protein [Kineococcus xinjiangensis]